MKQNILGKGKDIYAKELKGKRSIIILTAVIMVALNVIFTLLRTDERHTVMLICNIFTDIVFGWFLLFFISVVYLPKKRKLVLYKKFKEEYSGTVENISDTSEQYMNFNCRKYKINGHTFFVICDTLTDIKVGDEISFSASDNIIVEADKA